MDNTYLLKMQHVSKHFGGVAALDDVQLELKRGEVHAPRGLCGSCGYCSDGKNRIFSGLCR